MCVFLLYIHRCSSGELLFALPEGERLDTGSGAISDFSTSALKHQNETPVVPIDYSRLRAELPRSVLAIINRVNPRRAYSSSAIKGAASRLGNVTSKWNAVNPSEAANQRLLRP